jgi:hypothetical protein
MTAPYEPSTPQPVGPATAPYAGYQPPTRPNPFARIPARDFATDAVAFALLCLSFSQAWSERYWPWERAEVVLVTIVSLLSIGIFYIGRASGWPARTTLLVRGLLNVPYVVVVLFYAAADAVNGIRMMSGEVFVRGSLGTGLGPAVALGLAGVALTVQPRRVESDDPSLVGGGERFVRLAAWALLGVMLVEQVLAVVALVTGTVRLSASGLVIAYDLLVVVAVAALTCGPLLLTLLRRPAWRWVLVAVAATVLLGSLHAIDSSQARTHFAWSVLSGNAAYPYVAAAGALALAPAMARAMAPVEPPVRVWFDVVRAALLTLGVAAGLYAVAWLVAVGDYASNGRTVPGWVVELVVLNAVAAVAAVVAAVTFRGDPLGTRPVVIGVAIGIAVVGLGIITAGPLARTYDVLDLTVALGLPVLVVLALTVPEPVRRAYAAVRPAAPAPAAQAADHLAPPVPPAPTHGFTAAQASDPGTDLAVLAAIAERAPELRPRVALNPSTYPDLLHWLAQLHDPAVDAALAARRS